MIYHSCLAPRIRDDNGFSAAIRAFLCYFLLVFMYSCAMYFYYFMYYCAATATATAAVELWWCCVDLIRSLLCTLGPINACAIRVLRIFSLPLRFPTVDVPFTVEIPVPRGKPGFLQSQMSDRVS